MDNRHQLTAKSHVLPDGRRARYCTCGKRYSGAMSSDAARKVKAHAKKEASRA